MVDDLDRRIAAIDGAVSSAKGRVAAILIDERAAGRAKLAAERLRESTTLAGLRPRQKPTERKPRRSGR